MNILYRNKIKLLWFFFKKKQTTKLCFSSLKVDLACSCAYALLSLMGWKQLSFGRGWEGSVEFPSRQLWSSVQPQQMQISAEKELLF